MNSVKIIPCPDCGTRIPQRNMKQHANSAACQKQRGPAVVVEWPKTSKVSKRPPHRTNLGRVLRAYRLHHESDMRTLSAEVGVSPAMWCRMEAGYHPDVTTWMGILMWFLMPEKERRP